LRSALDQDVVARAPVEGVLTRAAAEHVVALTAEQLLVVVDGVSLTRHHTR
jgi:hypothetical protein